MKFVKIRTALYNISDIVKVNCFEKSVQVYVRGEDYPDNYVCASKAAAVQACEEICEEILKIIEQD